MCKNIVKKKNTLEKHSQVTYLYIFIIYFVQIFLKYSLSKHKSCFVQNTTALLVKYVERDDR